MQLSLEDIKQSLSKQHISIIQHIFSFLTEFEVVIFTDNKKNRMDKYFKELLVKSLSLNSRKKYQVAADILNNKITKSYAINFTNLTLKKMFQTLNWIEIKKNHSVINYNSSVCNNIKVICTGVGSALSIVTTYHIIINDPDVNATIVGMLAGLSLFLGGIFCIISGCKSNNNIDLYDLKVLLIKELYKIIKNDVDLYFLSDIRSVNLRRTNSVDNLEERIKMGSVKLNKPPLIFSNKEIVEESKDQDFNDDYKIMISP
jgi:hypothetical protein